MTITDQPAAWEQLEQEIITCERCPRLVAWRRKVAVEKKRAYRDQEYWGKPAPGFGDHQARLLVVGLAPGAHGANRTGRMFTGDSSGTFLFGSMYRCGFASQPTSTHRGDGLSLTDLYIGATCRCAPPDNKPTREEMDNCLPFLLRELDLLTRLEGIVALGRIGFDSVLKALRLRGATLPPASSLIFAHGAAHDLGTGLPWLLASYHPSQQNTSTGRLTAPMMDAIWIAARARLNPSHS